MELVGAFLEILTCVGLFPIVWQQVSQVQIVIAVVQCNLGKHIGQPFPGVHITRFTAPQQGIHDGSILRGIMIATKQISLSPNGQGPDGILGQIIKTFG